jgi:hypothetical protein
MDIVSQDESDVYNQQKEKFIVDWSEDRYNFRKLFNKYGEDAVRQWVKEDYCIIKSHDLAAQNEIRAQQFSNLKPKAYDLIDQGMAGKPLTDAQLKIALWVLSGEKAFAEAFAKSKGEQKALNVANKDGTVLEFIRGQKTD